MKNEPKILMELTKEEVIKHINDNSASIKLYGCPSGKTYSNCHNS
jgi:hypothetical protein